MKVVNIPDGILESILNEGLCVLCGVFEVGEGELFRLEGVADGDQRRFFARVTFEPDGGVIQFALQPFMEAKHPETGEWERMPMAGEYANEKCNAPVTPAPINLAVKGEKPIWLYRGVKWVAEISLSRIFFGMKASEAIHEGKPVAPGMIYLKVQGQGGETEYAYKNIGVALKPADVEMDKLA